MELRTKQKSSLYFHISERMFWLFSMWTFKIMSYELRITMHAACISIVIGTVYISTGIPTTLSSQNMEISVTQMSCQIGIPSNCIRAKYFEGPWKLTNALSNNSLRRITIIFNAFLFLLLRNLNVRFQSNK